MCLLPAVVIDRLPFVLSPLLGATNASAMCTRIAPTQYQCDWILDRKPTGSLVDKFDPAHKSVRLDREGKDVQLLRVEPDLSVR